ncbi:LPXTG cell wall anchor domain-containing protein [Neobacillus sp. K501]
MRRWQNKVAGVLLIGAGTLFLFRKRKVVQE